MSEFGDYPRPVEPRYDRDADEPARSADTPLSRVGPGWAGEFVRPPHPFRDALLAPRQRESPAVPRRRDPISLGLRQVVDAPAVHEALRGLVGHPGEPWDAAFRDALRELPSGASGSLAKALIRDGDLRLSLASAVRAGPDSREARWFLIRYLAAYGRANELDQLRDDPAAPSPVANVHRLFHADDVRMIGRLHHQWAAESEVAPTLRYQRADPSRDGGYLWEAPKAVPVWLEVAAPAHGHITTSGLSRHFRADTVHAQASTAVADANDCHWRTVDHYHVHRMTMSVEPLMDDGRARQALAKLRDDPSDGNVEAFQRAIRDLVAPAPDGPTRVRVPIEPRHHTEIVDPDAVQTGDGSRLTIRSKYILEESELPLVAMLADSRDLVRQFAAALDDDSGAATRSFVGAVAAAAGRVPDLDIVRGAADLPQRETLLNCLFGVAQVEDAAAVMIGSGNRLDTTMRVRHPGLDKHELRTDLHRLHLHLQPPAHSPSEPVDLLSGSPPVEPPPEPEPVEPQDDPHLSKPSLPDPPSESLWFEW